MSKKKQPAQVLYGSWLDNMIMVISAHRYCLGRETYVVGACIDWLTAIWPVLESNTQSVILRDTIEALMDGNAGFPSIDVPAWKRFCEEQWTRISHEQQVWIEGALSHKDKPWPLFVRITRSYPKNCGAYDDDDGCR